MTRTGVHHPTAGWGSTLDLDWSGEITPQQLFEVILDFLDVEAPSEQPDRQYGATTDEQDEAAARERLRDMGYL